MIEEQLIEQVLKAKDGNQEAIHILFDEHKDGVYCFLTHYVHNDSDIEDICQETFISAFTSIKTIENPAKFKNWLFTIAYRRAMDFHRTNISIQKKAFTENEGVLEDIPEDNDEFIPSEMLESEETRKYITDLVMKLPEEQKTAVLLHYYQQISIPDISEMLECSVGTIKSRLYYARQSIKADIEKKQKKGYKVIAVAPFPLLTQILQKQEKKMPKETSERVWNGVEISLPVTAPITPMASVIKIAGIAIPTKIVVIIASAIVLVIVASAVYLKQGDTATQVQLISESQQTNIADVDSSQPSEISTAEQTDTQMADVQTADTLPQTKAEYARLYYDFVQKILLKDPDFLDAEIVASSNGKYGLVALFYNGQSHADSENELNYEHIVAALEHNSMYEPVYREYDYAAIYLVDYDGIETEILEPYGHPNKYDKPKIRQLQEDGRFVLYSDEYNDSKVNASISTWGFGHGNEDFTKGERLKSYFK